MTGVLHLQTRAYPLHFAFPPGYGPGAPAVQVEVPELGTLTFTSGKLTTFEYNVERMAEADLTEIIAAGVALPGTAIAGCHARLIPGGVVLVTYALRHDADLAAMSVGELVTFDAQVNDKLREADQAILINVLAEIVKAFPLVRPAPAGEERDPSGDSALPADRRAIRYNCHVITKKPGWNRRTDGTGDSHGCEILLPFTYAWSGDPAARLQDILAMTEPADIVVAQRSILVDATLEARKILDRLASGPASQPQSDSFRRFLDRVWADYYHLDSYRMESAQASRIIFQAAHETVGMDSAYAQAQALLGHVTNSLLAASSARSEALDKRLNRAAAALTVLTTAGFLSGLAGFLAPHEELGVRVAIVALVIIIAAGILSYTVSPGRVSGSPALTPRLTGQTPPREPSPGPKFRWLSRLPLARGAGTGRPRRQRVPATRPADLSQDELAAGAIAVPARPGPPDRPATAPGSSPALQCGDLTAQDQGLGVLGPAEPREQGEQPSTAR